MASPTLRRRRLSRLLREQREELGWTASKVAKEAKARSGKPRGWSASKLTRLEGGDWKRVNSDDVLTLLDVYGVTDPSDREAYVALAREANQRGWWASFGDALGSGQFVGLESEASSIRTYESMCIPGLLQTPEYARAIISGNGLVADEDELTTRVDARMFRKNVFTKTKPVTFWAVLDEAALLRITPALSDQLEHLLHMGSQSNIGIQVLPIDRGPHAAMTGQFVIMEFPLPDPPVVYLEVMSEELYLEKPEEITRYQHVYDYVQAEALSVSDSRQLIRDRLASL
ncbi:helix-turn-helix domain-containing protein [Nocardiopsis aegyptia]|uniref:Transcriptional regulator with XRE-family HTH domain n=1 Tax=Nocardiopsis aegyptia TaxID=220378 RepID=A0A7Z0EPR6_9ACTN|nr:helix-turn-helix transcriptional regulator [Nocardiopsis aegyptia]NYJ36035.1 transcriptional regulator with XRE-family HTH domain [Nocardiopsis aegyptia]